MRRATENHKHITPFMRHGDWFSAKSVDLRPSLVLILSLILTAACTNKMDSLGNYEATGKSETETTPRQEAPTSTPDNIKPTVTVSITPSTPIHVIEPLPEGRIAFIANWDGDYEVYAFDSFETSVAQITNNEVDDFLPRLSPNGKEIVFVSHREKSTNIFKITVGGTEEVRLTNDLTDNTYPNWDLTGQHILFMSRKMRTVSVMDSEGFSQKLIFSFLDTAKYSFVAAKDLAWSPDNMLIAWTTIYGDTTEQSLDLIDISSGISKRLLYSAGEPSWSPDGRKIAFAMLSTDDEFYHIYTMNIDGTELTQVTNASANDRTPSWSPSGKYIAFTSNQDGPHELYMINSDGTSRVRLLAEEVNAPNWGQQ